MNACVIIDCGSGYTKMGLSGSAAPAHVIPTVMYRGERSELFPLITGGARDEQVLVGNAALRESMKNAWGSVKPILEGRVSDWTDFELFFQTCYSEFLKIDPSDRPCVLTEPPMNPVKNRQKLTEIMFETFGVPSLYIGVQAVLALYTYWDGQGAVSGTVVDAGDGVTHVIPVSDGYVTGAYEVPIGGKDVTRFIADTIVRRTSLPAGEGLTRLAQQIKEKLAYVSANPVKEFALYDKDHNMFREVQWTDPSSANGTQLVEIGYERFLGSEIFFSPQLISGNHPSLPVLIYDAIQAAPIDCRKKLMSNIVLSGGSTLFPNFASRLENEMAKLCPSSVHVLQNAEKQRFAVWHGASVLAQTPGFANALCSRQQYFERDG